GRAYRVGRHWCRQHAIVAGRRPGSRPHGHGRLWALPGARAAARRHYKDCAREHDPAGSDGALRTMMTIKKILVAASGGSATGGAIDLACRVAERFQAHLEGYHVPLYMEAALAWLGEAADLQPTGTVIESMIGEAQEHSVRTRALFN